MDNERIRIHGKKIRFPKTIETNSIESNNYSKKPQVISLPIVVILVLIMSSLSGAAGAYFIISSYKSNVTTTNGITTSTTPLNETNSISNAVSKVYDATVVLEVYKDKELISTGTGFVYKKENGKAYLMTNNHVVNGGDEIKILFTDSTETKAEVVGKDTYSDIAVLTVKDSTSITAATLGASKKSRVGDTIFAVGSPEGSDYAGTVTKGILSARERLIEVALSNSNETDYYMQVLQTDAAINPGNSGGPLCNTNGEVIGITNMKLVDDTVEGMGFAIPIEDAIKVSALLEKEGKITVDSRLVYADMTQFRYNSLKEPEIDFTEDELNVINAVIEKLSKMNATQISEYSHGDMPWRAAEDYEIMKYSFVFYRDPKYRVREYDTN